MGHLQMLFQYFFSPFLFRGGQNGHNDSRAGAEKSPPFARKTQKEGRKANLNVLQYIHKSKQWHSLTLYSDIYTVMEFLSIVFIVSQGVHVNFIFQHTEAIHSGAETQPERIYNSHYGNGVPAMFTSQCCPAER